MIRNVFFVDSTSMCAQTIFSGLDFLTAWVVEKSKAAITSKGEGASQNGMFC